MMRFRHATIIIHFLLTTMIFILLLLSAGCANMKYEDVQREEQSRVWVGLERWVLCAPNDDRGLCQ